MAKCKRAAVKLVDAATAEENLRRGNEQHAIYWGLPKEIELRTYCAQHALAEVKLARLPEHLKYDVTSTATYMLRCLEILQEHVKRGEIGQAVLAGIEVGISSERIGRLYFQKHVERSNDTNRKLRQGAEEQAHPPEEIEKALALYAKLTKGTGKKTAAQRKVRAETGIPESVLRYHLAKRKRTAEKNL